MPAHQPICSPQLLAIGRCERPPMPNSIGTLRYVLMRDALPATATRASKSAGFSRLPPTAAMMTCCRGQMTNQTLNHMIVPSVMPNRIHAWLAADPPAKVNQPPKWLLVATNSEYRMYSRPDRNVIMAPQRNHQKARPRKFGTTVFF